MVRHYGAKKDANHNEIAQALEAGMCATIDISATGRGLPDLIVHHPRRGTQLVEVKNMNTGYGRKGANSNQKAWANGWPLPVYILKTIDDAAKFIAGDFESLEKYGGYSQ
jgi:hypothetical protein